MNKNANMLDIGFMAVIVFIAAIVFLSAIVGYNGFVNKALNNTQINSSSAAVDVLKNTQNLQTKYDFVTLGIIIGFILAIIITSWMIAGNPLFTFIYFVVWILFVVVSIIFSYAWNKVSTMPVFTNSLTYIPITNFVLDHLSIFITVVGAIGMLITFAKPYVTGEGQ